MTAEPGSRGRTRGKDAGITRSREETEERILEAALALMRNSGTSNISLRQVAQAAGVSHPLVLRYFGSKQGLAAAVVQRMAYAVPRRPMSLPPYPMVVAASKSSFLNRDKQRGYVRMAVCSCPDTDPGFDQSVGRDLLERLQSFEERTIALDGARPIDRRVVAAAIAALSVGWQISEKWLERTFGLGELDEATLADHFSRLCGYMAELALPAPGQPAEDEAAPS